MLRNWSGEMISTWWPRRSNSALVRCRVRTTPLTCGAQASVTRARRNWAASLTRRREAEIGRQHGELPLGRPLDDLEPAVAMLHQRGAALDPVAIVAIEDAVDGLDLGLVDVAAHHAVKAAALGFLRHRMLEVADELDRVLDPGFQERRQRPVGIAEPQAYVVVPVIDAQAPGIGVIA